MNGDILVLYTDGYADQFGGPDDKKFKYRPLKELLLQCADKSSKEFEVEMNKVFDDWKGSNAQTDDVCLVSVKVSIT